MTMKNGGSQKFKGSFEINWPLPLYKKVDTSKPTLCQFCNAGPGYGEGVLKDEIAALDDNYWVSHVR